MLALLRIKLQALLSHFKKQLKTGLEVISEVELPELNSC